MKNILVTGANKGIGLAVVSAALSEQPDARLILASRNAERGKAAVDALLSINPFWKIRLEYLELDVTSDSSVEQARDALPRLLENKSLDGLVNNAGLGLGSTSPYGLSKACANSYTVCLARQHPELFVNACTPGFIETDLGKDFLGSRTPMQAGMKSPADGARVIMQLLFEPPRSSGWYYGSDGLRSPLDSYRAPGSTEYAGD